MAFDNIAGRADLTDAMLPTQIITNPLQGRDRSSTGQPTLNPTPGPTLGQKAPA